MSDKPQTIKAAPCPFHGTLCEYVPMAHKSVEQATRIEALEAENARLREALKEINGLDDKAECCWRAGSGDGACCNEPEYGLDRAKRIARAALEEKV